MWLFYRSHTVSTIRLKACLGHYDYEGLDDEEELETVLIITKINNNNLDKDS